MLILLMGLEKMKDLHYIIRAPLSNLQSERKISQSIHVHSFLYQALLQDLVSDIALKPLRD